MPSQFTSQVHVCHQPMSLGQPVWELAPLLTSLEDPPTTPRGLPAPPPPALECRPRPSLSHTPSPGPAHPPKHHCQQGELRCFFHFLCVSGLSCFACLLGWLVGKLVDRWEQHRGVTGDLKPSCITGAVHRSGIKNRQAAVFHLFSGLVC